MYGSRHSVLVAAFLLVTTTGRTEALPIALIEPDVVAASDAGRTMGPAPGTQYVLLLQSFDRNFAPFDTFVNVFRSGLSRRSSNPIVFLEISVQASVTDEREHEDQLLRYVQAAIATHPPSLVVTVGGPAALFVQKHRRELGPAMPTLFAAVDHRFVDTNRLDQHETAVVVDHNPVLLVNNIVRVLPDVRNILVVVGGSPLDQFWKKEMQREFEVFANRLTFTWADQYSFDELLQRASALPPHWAILYTLFAVDSIAGPYGQEQALAEVHRVAKAPIFGFHTPQFGRGIVGGPLMPIEDVGRAATDVALRILSGDSPTAIRTPLFGPAPPVFDWRELRRWGIGETALPPGSTVQFRGPTVWQQYAREIAAATVVVFVLTVLVVMLIVNHFKRRRAERLLRESESRFRLFADTAPVMIWMSDVDQRRVDFNRPWLSFTGRTLAVECGAGWTIGVHPDDKEACINAFADAFDRHEPLEIEYRLRRADGEYRWIHDCATPRTAPDGSFAGYIGSASDITEQKAAKLMLVDFNRMLLKAQETERTRIARELHDDFSQRVAGLTMLLHRVTERLGEGRDWTRVTLSEVCHQLSAVTREISALSRRLHPPVLGLLGLAKAAASYCKETSAQHNVPIQFTHANVPLDLSDDVTLGLFRVLQEALGNAVKHSKAQHIQIILLGSDDHIQLDVHDDGVGFDPTRAGHAKGLGLLSMEERLRLMNGVLVINSKPGSGTSLQARVSLAARRTSLSQSVYAQEAGSRASSISERR